MVLLNLKIKCVTGTAVAIIVLCFMDTRLWMLPVNKYTNDLTLGERQNKQYTNKYIIVYIL